MIAFKHFKKKKLKKILVNGMNLQDFKYDENDYVLESDRQV